MQDLTKELKVHDDDDHDQTYQLDNKFAMDEIDNNNFKSESNPGTMSSSKSSLLVSTMLQSGLTLPVRDPLTKTSVIVTVFAVQALYDYVPTPPSPELLSFRAGDILTVYSIGRCKINIDNWEQAVDVGGGWCQVENIEGNVGYCPVKYVEVKNESFLFIPAFLLFEFLLYSFFS